MENSIIDPNTKLAAVYYNGGKPPHLFKIRTDITLSWLKDQLDQINRQLNKFIHSPLFIFSCLS